MNVPHQPTTSISSRVIDGLITLLGIGLFSWALRIGYTAEQATHAAR